MEIVSFRGKPRESFSRRPFAVVIRRGGRILGGLTFGRLITGRLVVGRLIIGRLIICRLIAGRLVVGRLIAGRLIVGRNIVWRRDGIGEIASRGNLLTVSTLSGSFFSFFRSPGFFLLFLDLRALIGDFDDRLGLVG